MLSNHKPKWEFSVISSFLIGYGVVVFYACKPFDLSTVAELVVSIGIAKNLADINLVCKSLFQLITLLQHWIECCGNNLLILCCLCSDIVFCNKLHMDSVDFFQALT